MTINKNEDFSSRSNSDWASKLIISIDEVLLDRREDSERIKNLSTASTYKVESKGKDKVETNFFGKFILCSNKEENIIQIEEKERRDWGMKVNSFGKEDVDMLKKLHNEIPQFLHFLNTRKIKTERLTRMWFTKEQIYTPALVKVVKGNKTYLSQEIKEILIDDFVAFEVDVLRYTASDLLRKLIESNIRTIRNKVSSTLKLDYGIEPNNGSYKKYFLSLSLEQKSIVSYETKKGRYFEFKKEDFITDTVDC
jgi:hypothetical protein